MNIGFSFESGKMQTSRIPSLSILPFSDKVPIARNLPIRLVTEVFLVSALKCSKTRLHRRKTRNVSELQAFRDIRAIGKTAHPAKSYPLSCICIQSRWCCLPLAPALLAPDVRAKQQQTSYKVCGVVCAAGVVVAVVVNTRAHSVVVALVDGVVQRLFWVLIILLACVCYSWAAVKTVRRGKVLRKATKS